MIKKALYISTLTIISGVIFSSSTVAALSGSQFKSGRIMDDPVFFNKSAMSASQIQSFLNSKVPSCDTNGSKIYSGSTTRKQYAASKGVSAPFVCLKSYKQNTPSKNTEAGLCGAISARSNQTAAQIIYNVSSICGVSSKVLLVLLQKEQSLVTDDWPWPIQYRSATGYGCPDTAPCDSEYYGFFNQVYHAARQYKRYARDASDFNYRSGFTNYIQWHPKSSCGGSNVLIENQTTAGLYNYTPYRPNQAALNNLYGTGDSCSSYGNRNFWRMYNDWFGTTYGSPFFRINNGSAIYALGSENNYYHVSSRSVLEEYGYATSSKYIVSVDSNYVSGLTMSGSLSPLVRFQGAAIYLMDGARIHHFTSPTLLNQHGFAIGEESKLPSWMQTYYKSSSDMQEIVKQKGGDPRYFMDNGERRHIADAAAYNTGSPAYSSRPVVELGNDYISSRAEGPPVLSPNVLIKKSNDTYGFWDGSQLQAISSQVVKDLGLKADYSASTNSINQLPVGGSSLGKLAKNSTNQLFLLDTKKKYLISASDLTDLGLNTNDFILTSSAFLAKVPTDNMSKAVRVNNSEAIYVIRSGELLHAYGRSALSEAGFSVGDAKNINSASLQLFSQNGRKLLSTGTIYRIGKTAPVYIVSSLTTKLHIPSRAVLDDFGFHMSDVLSFATNETSLYPTAGTLNRFVKNSSNQVWLIQKGSYKHSAISSVYGSSQFNINSNDIFALSDSILAKYSSGKTLKAVVRADKDARVYKIENGQKRWVTSPVALSSAGFSMSDVVSISPSYLDEFPNGPNI